MKNRIPTALVTLLVLTLLIPSFVLAQQAPPPAGRLPDTPRSRPNIIAPEGRSAGRRERVDINATAGIESDFAEALTVIQDNYVDGSKIEYDNVFKSSIIGMLRSLDPHSNFYDAKEFEELRADWRSEYYGIGATIGDRRIGERTDTYILSTFPDTPAAQAGLRYGDRIVEVDGQAVQGKPSGEVRDKLRGQRGTEVKITVERASTGAKETVTITRDAVTQSTVPDAYMIRSGIGYVDMTRGFNYDTGEEFQKALETLHAKGMTALVLDLRNNPGGLLDQAVAVAERFLQKDELILSQKGRGARGGGDRKYVSKNTKPDATPLVVLVNRSSASASEIVAGALQDHDRALIVGETSFGKGLVQSIMPLDYGTALTLTTTKYLTPSGRLIQRDYSNGSLYDYYTRGGLGQQDADANASEQSKSAKPTGPESRTDTGRTVFGGGGIAPDEAIKPRLITPAQQRLLDPLFAFARELVNNRISGFDQYKVQRAIDFEHQLLPADFAVTDQLFKTFKDFVVSKKEYKLTAAQLDRQREYIARQLRYELATAAYGTTTASRVPIGDDPQVIKAIEVLPRARELAATALRGRNPQQKTYE